MDAPFGSDVHDLNMNALASSSSTGDQRPAITTQDRAHSETVDICNIGLPDDAQESDLSSPNEPVSEEMSELLAHQKEISTWMQEVKERMFALETSYLEDTPMGNIVRGWEQAKIFSTRSRKISDKERLFTSSSYDVWLANKNKPVDEGKGDEKDSGFVKNKKFKKTF